jgi:exodeoxyribonuclease X
MIVIRIVDLETTGFPPDAEVIEIAMVDVRVEPLALPRIDTCWIDSLVKPCRPIPPESSAIHHMIDDDVARAAPWSVVWKAVGGTPDIWCAHSAKFERAFISDEMTGGKPWICTWKCALRLWPDAPRHSNQVLRYWLKPAGLDRAKASIAHRAGPDAYVTAHLLAAMLELASVEQLIAWSNEPAVLARVPFGKDPPAGSRGMKWTEVDHSLLYWTADRDFDEYILHSVKLEIARRVKEAEEAEAAEAAQSAVSEEGAPA